MEPSLSRVTDLESRLFVECMAILRDSIPRGEHLPTRRMQELLAGNGYQLLALTSRTEAVQGVAIIYISAEQPCCLLDYMAVSPGRRGQGVGTSLFHGIIGAVRSIDPPLDWLILEVDDDREGDAQHQATCARRTSFYRRLGARLLENVPYQFPSAFVSPVPMRLMVCRLRPNVTLSADDLKRAVADIFLHVHGRGEDDELLRWFYSNLPDEIEME